MNIQPHRTGHVVARDGRLLRVDVTRVGWVATRFNLDLTVHDMVFGTDEQTHALVEHWRGAG
jgi:hypothetical protein